MCVKVEWWGEGRKFGKKGCVGGEESIKIGEVGLGVISEEFFLIVIGFRFNTRGSREFLDILLGCMF